MSEAEDNIEYMETTLKKKKQTKSRKLLTQNIQDTMRRPNLRIINIEESEYFQINVTVNIFKIVEENFPNLKKEMPRNIKEAFRT